MSALMGFFACRAGNFATLFALCLPVVIGVAAFTVDEASLYLEKRQLQTTADMAAIYAAMDHDSAAQRIALALTDAGYNPQADLIGFQTGTYTADPALAAGQRFVSGATPVNAVRVQLRDTGRVYFSSIFGFAPPDIAATALASASPRAAFSIGSRLASFNDGVLNAVLGGLLGTTIAFDVLDYRALADIEVQLLDVLDALAIHAELTAGTYGDLLQSDVALKDLAVSLASAANDHALLLELTGLIDDDIRFDMARLMTADGIANLAIGTSAALEARINALQTLTGAAAIADGERQIRLDLGADVPGLLAIDVRLAVGEPPQGGWFAFSGAGSIVRTAQVRLIVTVEIGAGGSRLDIASIHIPIHAQLAPAEAELTALDCPAGRPDLAEATIAVRPGIMRLAVGQAPPEAFLSTGTPFGVERATLVSILGGAARVSGYADLAMDQIDPQSLFFDAGDVADGAVQTVSTTTPLTSLTASVLGDLDLQVHAGGLGLLGTALTDSTDTVGNLVEPMAPVLDQVLIALFDVLGLGLGEADIRVHGFDCRNATLVQ